MFSEANKKKFRENRKIIFAILGGFISLSLIVFFVFVLPNREESPEKKAARHAKEDAAAMEKLNSRPKLAPAETNTSASYGASENPLVNHEKRAEIEAFASMNKNGFLATIDVDEPRVRGMRLIKIIGDKWFFATSKSKATSTQIRNNSNVEWISYSPNTNETVRIFGAAYPVEDESIKMAAIRDVPALTKKYSDSLSVLELFYIVPVDASIYKP